MRTLFAAACAAIGLFAHGQASAQFTGGGPPQAIPIADVVFVIDRSSSIGSTDYREITEAVAASIGAALPATPNNRVAVVVFDDAGEVAIPFTPANDPTLPGTIEDLITSHPSGGGTDVRDGMRAAMDLFFNDTVGATHSQLVLITDAVEECAYREADFLRHYLDVRTSVGYFEEATASCAQLGLVFDIADYDSLVDQDIRHQVRIANAEINPPFVGSPAPGSPPGIVGCLPDIDPAAEIAVFLDDALCPVRHSHGADTDGNGVPDVCEATDCNGNLIPDRLDPDCDQDGIPDDCELDCTGDGVPDPCDCNCNGILDSSEPDCDGDGIPDDCEPDCDGDGIPDDCEPDCDGDGLPDDCEPDCDGDGIPDECDSDTTDCDGDGIPDSCEPDCDEDGIPDDCDPDVDGDLIPDSEDPLIGPCDRTLYGGPRFPIGTNPDPCASGGGKI